MDTLNDVMTDLLIDQDGRLEENRVQNGNLFINRAHKAEKIILEVTGEGYGHQN
jgi:hypothetical protein